MKFWMVMKHNKFDQHRPAVRHETLSSAKKEAERLCLKECDWFYVLEAKYLVKQKQRPVEWSEL